MEKGLFTGYKVIFICISLSLLITYCKSEMTKEERSISVYDGQQDATLYLKEHCKSSGIAEEIFVGPFETRYPIQRRAIGLGANAAQIIYTDTSTGKYTVRFWSCR